MSEQVEVSEIPLCDICQKRPAWCDGKMEMGPWAYMCEVCWLQHGVGKLGTGYGQKLVLRGGDAS